MKKRVCFAVVLLLGYAISYTQVIDLFPPMNTASLKPGDTVSFSIKNTKPTGFSFYTLTKFDSVGRYIFLNEKSYFDYLRAGGTPMDAIRAVARVLKSPFFYNGPFESDDNDSQGLMQRLCDKKYSTIGFILATAWHKCGNLLRAGFEMVVRAGIILRRELFDISVPGHSIGEYVPNAAVAVDLDCGQPRFLDTLANGSYMSVQHLKDSAHCMDTQDQYMYTGPHGRDPRYPLVPIHKTVPYKALFQQPISRYPIPVLNPDTMNGRWAIPSEATLNFDFVMPDYAVDTADAQKKMLYDSALHYNATGQIMAAGIAMSQFFDTTLTEVMQIVRTGNFMLTNGSQVTITSSPFFQRQNKVTLHIPARSTPITTELSLPFLIKKVITSGPGVRMGDTTFPAGVSSFALYNEKNDIDEFPDDTTVPHPPAHDFQYVQSVYIPANTTVDLVMYYNQLIYGLPDGMRIELFGQDTSGIVATVTYPEEQVTAVELVAPPIIEEYTIKVFPNPAMANGIVQIQLSDQKLHIPVVLYDVLGRTVAECIVSEGRGHMQLPDTRGVYFIGTSKNMIQIVVH